MDESGKHSLAEQERLASDGGPVSVVRRQIKAQMIGLGAFAIIVWGLKEALGSLPRNDDNSMKLVYFGPVLTLLSVLAALFLRKDRIKRSPFRLTAWGVIVLTVIAIPAGTIDFLNRNGG